MSFQLLFHGGNPDAHLFPQSKMIKKKKACYGQLPFWIYVSLILGRKILGGYFFFLTRSSFALTALETAVRFGPQINGCHVTGLWIIWGRYLSHATQVAKEVTLMSVHIIVGASLHRSIQCCCFPEPFLSCLLNLLVKILPRFGGKVESVNSQCDGKRFVQK